MASVKNRSKAPKTAANKSKGRGKNTTSSTGVKNGSKSQAGMKRKCSLKSLTPDEKVQYILKKDLLVKNKLMLNNKNGKINKKRLKIVKESLMAKSIKPKKKDRLKLFGNILKSELLIEDSNTSKGPNVAFHKRFNNNDAGLNDQNKSDSKIDGLSHEKDAKQNINVEGQTNLKTNEESHQNTNSNFQIIDNEFVGRNNASNSTPKFHCDCCNKSFRNKSALRRHIYAHLNEKLYPCNYCTRSFYRLASMEIHVKTQHADSNEISSSYVCQICEKSFSKKASLESHLSGHIKKENPCKCVNCDKQFPNELLLKRHEKEHSETDSFQCKLCNVSYENKTKLSLHAKSHLNIKDYICQHCGKDFLRLNSMRRHVQICHVGHRIQCPICKKYLKGHLTEHMRTHEKKRPHECPDCGQRFTQSTQLNVHRRSHTGVRPYPCRICKRPFTHSNALMLHIRRHTGEKPFPCAMCPLSFSQLPHMKAHMRNIHGKENAYKCEKCKQFFKLKAQLEDHLKSCKVGDKELSFEEQIQASVQIEEVEVESVMSLSRMRFLLALLLTMIATKEKLKYLGFNKRLIDDIIVESLEAMGHTPCKDESLPPITCLRKNIEILLNGTIPKKKMEKFRKENKTTEELLELLTDEKKS